MRLEAVQLFFLGLLLLTRSFPTLPFICSIPLAFSDARVLIGSVGGDYLREALSSGNPQSVINTMQSRYALPFHMSDDLHSCNPLFSLSFSDEEMLAAILDQSYHLFPFLPVRQ